MSSPTYRNDVPHDTDNPDGAGARPADPTNTDGGANAGVSTRRSVVAREKERYGGIKWGSAFFGWLTATGTAVILVALLAAAGAAVGVATGTSTDEAQNQAAEKAGTLGLAGGITLLAVVLIAYYCGGYVAGRMARFNGVKQGVAVWIWAVVITAAITVAGAVLGAKYNVLDKVGLPVGGDDLTTGGLVALGIALIAALIGAVLGGLAGMRFHRKVDKAGLGH